jgi:hypothetical protein
MVVALLGLAGSAAVDGQIIPPPQGKDIKVQVARGGTVTIPVQGFDRNGRLLKFGLDEKQRPRWGSAGAPRPNGKNRATIAYTHGDDDHSTRDEFYYTIRLTSGGMTGRAKVTVDIFDAPPVPVLPEEIDFGQVALGDPPVTNNFTVANLGGGIFEGKIAPPEPFEVDDGFFTLGRNQSKKIRARFVPTKTGLFSYEVKPSAADPSTSISFRGEAIAPFEIRGESTVLEADENGERRVDLDVVNLSQQPQKIRAELPRNSPAKIDEVGIVQPGSFKRICVHLSSDDKTGIANLKVNFIGEQYAETVELSAPPLPAQVEVVHPLDFGTILPGKSFTSDFTLRNSGGLPARGRLQLAPPLQQPSGQVPAFEIHPGSTQSFSIVIKLPANTEETSTPSSLSVALGDQTLDVPITAKVESLVVPPPKTTPTPTPAPEYAWKLNSDIRYTEKSEIEWKQLPGWTGAHLERRDEPTTTWIKVSPSNVSKSDKSWWDKISSFFNTPIERNDPTSTLNHEIEEKWTTQSVESRYADGRTVWRLMASRDNETVQASAPFVITKDGQLLAAPSEKKSPPEKRTASVTRPPPPFPIGDPPVTSRSLTPETPILSAGISAERNSAALRIAIADNPKINGFRLERCAMLTSIDPKTGFPKPPTFEPIGLDGITITSQSVASAISKDKKFTMFLATIEGLPSGSRTYWRILPETTNGPLDPTTILLVDTQPDPPFPWRSLILGLLVALLAAVLYLRWKSHRIPVDA